jgi:peptide deformylase
VTVEAHDEDGQPLSFVANDYLAVCIQHEIDHLDGIVFLTRMSRLKAAFHRKKLNAAFNKRHDDSTPASH